MSSGKILRYGFKILACYKLGIPENQPGPFQHQLSLLHLWIHTSFYIKLQAGGLPTCERIMNNNICC